MPPFDKDLFGNEVNPYGPMPDDRQKPARLTRIRPVGTPGLPDVYERPLKEDVVLPADVDLPEFFIAALQELIREIKKTGAGQKRYELDKGHRVEIVDGDVLYRFPFSDEAELFEEAEVEVQVEGRRVGGTIMSIGAGYLILALEEDIGEEVRSVVLLIDATALLEVLKERIEAVKEEKITLTRALADSAIGKSSRPEKPDSSIEPVRGFGLEVLNDEQRRACESALKESLTFIWGPPGCGKTTTLAEIVRSAFEGEKRTLICSNTNKAVDQVLYRVCEALRREHPAMQEGRIVRLGRVVDDKLKEYDEYVTVDGIIKRLSSDLEAEKRRLESEIVQIDVRTEPARRVLAKFEALDEAEEYVLMEQENVKRLVDAREACRKDLGLNAASRERLDKELQRRRSAIFVFFRRSEEEIEVDIRRNEAVREQIETAVIELEHRHAQACRRLDQARQTRDARRGDVAGEDSQSARAIVDEANSKREHLVAKLNEVKSKIEALRESILKEARIVGATCTRTYLSQKDIGQFDLVIIDEASMVILPAAWFSAGLARERVVISGDFRQIPPIVPTEQKSIFEALGRDAFTASGMTDLKNPHLLMLETQHRMRPEICKLISKPMYEGRLATSPERSSKTGATPPEPFEEPLTIIDTSALSPFETQNAFKSRFNLLHALLARNLAWHFRRNGVIEDNHDLGICTPYAAQARLIGKLLEGDDLANLVQAGTVHRFQGDERRIVLLEIPESEGGFWALGRFVQGDPPDHIGARLINVAVSRAQDHLVVLANLTYLDKKLPSSALLRGILHKMQEQGRVVPGEELLELRPIEKDLAGLIGQVSLDGIAENTGIFNEDEFERGLAHDIQSAKESVVLFSGYITPARVAKLGDLLRSKTSEGVEVRCVTRPPRQNGTIQEAHGREAVAMLETIGAVVDFRSKIHQKVCLIDNEIVWWGSLNALSHMGHADEIMTRVINTGFARQVAAFMSKRPISAGRAQLTVAKKENPYCDVCKAHSVLKEGRFGLYFGCEKRCGWTRSMRLEMRQARSHETN